ncbi:SDR family NAD(P)-dependent oxidoreductase [Dyadobacter luteus]|jgi:NAD(P)H dehydrogenase (quinone)|uniref:SDR family NAD(P)-dependent oxidoreductase n=1 Tax=Dyadobacter luteus TaxID=2259619 RepID=A0A3D8Y4K5_9BACT|nr:SDR family oxidoreductase [Dyadobacter luteus]REA56495.1 SDR family NAD(P)-dependent oxidoreductase [Dyadobacter luteus]
MILVTGASGNLGTAVIANLLTKMSANKIAGLYRNVSKAQAFADKGIGILIGDYAHKASLAEALQGVEKLLLISSHGNDTLVEHKNMIDAAKEVGVRHIYYTSGALNKSVGQSQLGPLVDSYITTENYIIESGMTFTIFQNGLYSETIPFFVGEHVPETGIYLPTGNGKASFATRADMAEAIANVLAGEGHENKIYVTTALPSYSFADIARILSEISQKPVSYTSPDPSEYEMQLRKSGLDEGSIWYLLLLTAIIKNDEYEISASDLEQLLGRKPTDLRQYLKETFLS